MNEDRRSGDRSPSLPNRTGAINASGFPVCGLVSQIDSQSAAPRRTEGALSRRQPSAAVDSVSQAVHWFGPDRAEAFHRWVVSLAALSQPFCEARVISIPPHSYTPWLHDHYSLPRYYGCSDPGRPVSHRPPWFPDSRHLDFLPCHLQSPVSVLQPRSTPSALWALFRLDFVFPTQTRHGHRPNRVHSATDSSIASLRPGCSLPVALHPGVSPRCSYFQILALQCQPGRGLSPRCQDALSGARRPAALSGRGFERTYFDWQFHSAETIKERHLPDLRS